jgi:hypothetical protein
MFCMLCFLFLWIFWTSWFLLNFFTVIRICAGLWKIFKKINKQ